MNKLARMAIGLAILVLTGCVQITIHTNNGQGQGQGQGQAQGDVLEKDKKGDK